MSQQYDYDLCVIGGGINGAGIARDAAGRGLSVLLLEKGDLGGATSSASTKLIHGGLRYLEHYEFGLVRHALQEREVLLGIAPHIIWPLRFILPHTPDLRPAWLIRLGLFLYDNLSRRNKLESSRNVSLATSPLKNTYTKGFSYADCWVEDSRLVVLNAMDAAAKGATILPRTACTKIALRNDGWDVSLEGRDPVSARMVVNAAGPWVRDVLETSSVAAGTPGVRLVKGSHIIVPRFLDGDAAYILQQPDKRIVFAIPYEHDFTLIGTTDAEHHGDPGTASISDDEIDYLCAASNRYFTHQITPGDIVWTYSGVRPLLDDGEGDASSITRDYKIILDESYGAPLLSIFGGKITTYRHLAEEAVDQLTDRPAWTAQKALPGGDIANFKNFLANKRALYKHLPDALIARYARAYGTLMDEFAGDDMGVHFGDDIYEAEIRYLVDREWAQTLDDILWRRSKLGLHIGDETAQNIQSYLKQQ